jgi:hypothetical protein
MGGTERRPPAGPSGPGPEALGNLGTVQGVWPEVSGGGQRQDLREASTTWDKDSTLEGAAHCKENES